MNADNARITLVPLRRRSSPYTFDLAIELPERSQKLYQGRSYKYALFAYWNAIKVVGLLRATATIRLVVGQDRQDKGGFFTDIQAGIAQNEGFHAAYGDCREWRNQNWDAQHLVEKLISTVPGTPGASLSAPVGST